MVATQATGGSRSSEGTFSQDIHSIRMYVLCKYRQAIRRGRRGRNSFFETESLCSALRRSSDRRIRCYLSGRDCAFVISDSSSALFPTRPSRGQGREPGLSHPCLVGHGALLLVMWCWMGKWEKVSRQSGDVWDELGGWGGLPGGESRQTRTHTRLGAGVGPPDAKTTCSI